MSQRIENGWDRTKAARVARLAASNQQRREETKVPIGTRFSTMVVIGHEDRNGRGHCVVRCDCGREKSIVKWNLVHSKSCGCLQNEQVSAARTIHGETKTPTWIAWDSMLARCLNRNHKSWKDYGGRGIQVCDSWRIYTNFKADMGEKPDGMQLDRVNNMGNYEPSNCRWATSLQNANNKRSNVFIEHGGERLTISQWARRRGISPDTLACRLRAGWSAEIALTKPIRGSV